MEQYFIRIVIPSLYNLYWIGFIICRPHNFDVFFSSNLLCTGSQCFEAEEGFSFNFLKTKCKVM